MPFSKSSLTITGSVDSASAARAIRSNQSAANREPSDRPNASQRLGASRNSCFGTAGRIMRTADTPWQTNCGRVRSSDPAGRYPYDTDCQTALLRYVGGRLLRGRCCPKQGQIAGCGGPVVRFDAIFYGRNSHAMLTHRLRYGMTCIHGRASFCCWQVPFGEKPAGAIRGARRRRAGEDMPARQATTRNTSGTRSRPPAPTCGTPRTSSTSPGSG